MVRSDFLTFRYIFLGFLSFTLVISLAGASQGSSEGVLSGHIRDQTDLAIGGAQITIVGFTTEVVRVVRSGQDGRFEISGLAPDSYEVRVLAQGFAEHTQVVELGENETQSLNVRLGISTLSETITVTPTRREQKLGDLAASVKVLDKEDIQSSPALALDDTLRQIPSFSLFRRTSSLASHPTAQGVSLRGIGPSGVSRTLVLLDNFPFNDPFGGWVYWSRVPITSVDRIEIVEGPSSNVYGNFAMGGVIHILTRKPERRTLAAEGRFGNRETAKLDFFASEVWGRLGVSVDGTLFHTEGYKIVAPERRGRVDIEANTQHENFNLKLEYSPSADFSLFVKGSYFDEDRDNGTFLQKNDTQWRFLGGGVRFRTPDDSEWQVSFFSHFQNFGSNFSAVAADRNSERLALTQEVPTFGFGGLTQWSKSVSSSHFLTAGLDWRWIDGESQEIVFIRTPPIPVRFREVGGRQRMVGFFLQDSFTLVPEVQVLLSARFDHWRNYHATRRELAVFSGRRTSVELDEKENNIVSGRIGLLYHLTEGISLWSAVGSGFRAPTLNELYRQFRVGRIVTLNNSELGPERLIGYEGGLNFGLTEQVFWRVTGFWNRVKNPVSNVTLTIEPNLITRQRQNLGQTRIWGIQGEVQYRPNRSWTFDAAYLLNEATVRHFPANITIEGNRLPQVPRHRFTVGAAYNNPAAVKVALHGRYVGAQFDDDRNLFTLGNYFVVDATVSRPLGEAAEVFLAVENLFDREYSVRTNPASIGTPALIQGGVRFRLTP
ncbi:TonB-dependent receptor [Acidobacteria bacterium AH-259-D05]|nr:TonB-dependent receptor [Acidobacteria bacterium AH-259-D05]